MQLVRRPIEAIDKFLFEPIDAGVYAAVRIVYASVALSIVVELWPVRRDLFGPDGMLARPPWLGWYLPLRWVTSDRGVTALMLGVGLCAVFTGIGFLTRVSTLVLYLWAISYDAAANPASAGYDGLVRLGAFALLVSPPARRFAVDGIVFGPGPATLPRYGLRLMQWQLAVIYGVTVWLKVPDSYWRSGQLMSYFFMSNFSRIQTPQWAHWGRLSAALTWGTLLFETTIPFLLFSVRRRRAGFALGLLLHGGIAITSVAGMFSLAMTPFYASFLQAEDIDDLKAFARAFSSSMSRRFTVARG